MQNAISNRESEISPGQVITLFQLVFKALWCVQGVFLLVHSHRSSVAEPSFLRPIEYTFSRGRINRYI